MAHTEHSATSTDRQTVVSRAATPTDPRPSLTKNFLPTHFVFRRDCLAYLFSSSHSFLYGFASGPDRTRRINGFNGDQARRLSRDQVVGLHGDGVCRAPHAHKSATDAASLVLHHHRAGTLPSSSGPDMSSSDAQQAFVVHELMDRFRLELNAVQVTSSRQFSGQTSTQPPHRTHNGYRPRRCPRKSC